jgi:uridine kinase
MKAAPAAILLFDGIVLLQPRLRPCWDYSIFVKVEFDVALARSLRRDLPTGGDPARLEQRYRSRYLPGQQHYLAECEPESHADLIIENNDPPNAFVSDRLTPR